ncbi:formyl transferase [Aquicoccus sp. SU-CL01552]|uniref:formyl transferase n=1 Tax=Aquicoccus sp. SU-CL01552 TaxID=3127656 RepID=UPI00310A4FB5
MKLVLLAGDGPSTNILRNYLEENVFAEIETIIEEPPSRKAMLAHRRRKLGIIPVIGQVAFMGLVLPFLRRGSKRRRLEILSRHGLKETTSDRPAIRVKSINTPMVADHLASSNPDAVVVNGTRIIRDNILSAADCPYINIHAGITPRYRGVHGGYWALWAGDENNFGATIHLVDKGVDTGGVLRHVRPKIGPSDNFSTYPLIQQAAALPELLKVLRQVSDGDLRLIEDMSRDQSRQWYHPTILQYLSGRLRGVK